MLTTEERQPGLISCGWAEKSPEFFYWWIKMLHMPFTHGDQSINLQLVCTSPCQWKLSFWKL